ncbi:MAG: hypothetical protein ABJB61_02345 [bacterium]
MICTASYAVGQQSQPAHVTQTIATWEKFAPKGAGFTVLLPGKPKSEDSRVETKLGLLINHQYSLQDHGAAYMIAYAEFPGPESDEVNIAKILDGARDNAISNVKGELKSEKVMRIGRHFGREWLVRSPNAFIRARAYWVNERLYQLIMLMPPAAETGPAYETFAAKFFDSFALTEN